MQVQALDDSKFAKLNDLAGKTNVRNFSLQIKKILCQN